MNYKEFFLPYALEINEFLAQFFHQKINQSQKITPTAESDKIMLEFKK